MFKKIDETIIFDIIDFYAHQKEEQNQSEKSDEIEQIFDLLKDDDEPIFLMHFLLQIDGKHLDKNMIDYIINHINDEIALKETPIFTEIAKEYFQEKKKKFLNFNLITHVLFKHLKFQQMVTMK